MKLEEDHVPRLVVGSRFVVIERWVQILIYVPIHTIETTTTLIYVPIHTIETTTTTTTTTKTTTTKNMDSSLEIYRGI